MEKGCSEIRVSRSLEFPGMRRDTVSETVRPANVEERGFGCLVGNLEAKRRT